MEKHVLPEDGDRKRLSRSAMWKRIRQIFTRNVVTKVICVVFALLLWAYVLTDQKPMRSISVSNVPVSFDGEADLIAKGLCIRGDRSALIKTVTATVRCQITNASYLNARTVSAGVNLRNVSEARTYTLPVTLSVSSALGVAQSVNPSNVELEIDTLMTKSVPVTVRYIDQVPNGYWADMSNVTVPSRVEISGPRKDISRVVSGSVEVTLSEQTDTIYRTYDVKLRDSAGNEVNNDIIVGQLPTATVRVPIYAAKTVPVDVEGSLIGTDNLAANHVLYSAVATPAEVRIIGTRSAVDEVESVLLEPINVSGFSEPYSASSEPVLPDGIRIPDLEDVHVTIDVRESVFSQEFVQVPVAVEGLPKGYAAELDSPTADLAIEGRYSIASIVKRGDVRLSVDVTGLEEGTHELPVTYFIRDEDTTIELSATLSPETVRVTITAPQG